MRERTRVPMQPQWNSSFKELRLQNGMFLYEWSMLHISPKVLQWFVAQEVSLKNVTTVTKQLHEEYNHWVRRVVRMRCWQFDPVDRWCTFWGSK